MPTKVEISSINGNPALIFDGKPVSPVSVLVVRIDQDEVKRFAATGIHLYTFPMNLGEDETFKVFDRMVANLAKADPQACFFPRVGVEPPVAWLKAHDDDIVKDNFGKNYNLRVSFASVRWLDKMGPVFAKFVRHMEKNHGDRIIGYHIAAGLCGEWFWGCGENLDFSKAGIDGFRSWAKNKYGNRIAALNKSWLTKYGDFNQLSIPSVEERVQSDLSTFRDPRRRQFVIDYYFFLQDTTADRIIYFAKIAKKETAGNKITGVFYGYTNDVTGYCEANQLQGCGHAAMAKVLNCKEVDFLTSPFNYYDRNVGGSDWAHGTLDSILLHNKFFYCEADTRTFRTEAEDPAYWNLKVQTIEGSIEVLKRNFAYALTKSSGIWWMELTGHQWFNDKKILATLRQTQKIYRNNIGRLGSSVADIAVILDEKAPLFLADNSHVLHSTVFYQTPQLAKAGAPYDFYLLNDFEKIRDYKLYLFLDVFNIDQNQIKKIHNKLQSGKSTAVWLYSPGIIDGHKISIQNMKKLTGIKIDYLDIEASIKIKLIENAKHPLIAGFEKNFLFGGEGSHPSNKGFQEQHPNIPLKPVFYACDPQATVLGRINVGDRPGFVLKELPGWNSIYCAVGAIPSVLLQRIARYAGVHIYTDKDDVVYANSKWLSFHSRSDGSRTIKLPAPATVTDAFSGKVVCNAKKAFTLKFKKHCTYLYALDYR